MSQHYEILQPDGVRLQIEGELSEWKGRLVMLDGQGKPWLLIADEDVVTPSGERKQGDVKEEFTSERTRPVEGY